MNFVRIKIKGESNKKLAGKESYQGKVALSLRIKVKKILVWTLKF